jgi:hypothetical protein
MISRFMHNPVSRIVRTCIGWALVVDAVYQPIGVALVMMAIGTVIAVLAIADVCVLEELGDAVRRQHITSGAPHGRHA